MIDAIKEVTGVNFKTINNDEEAIKIANERVKKGIKEYDVVLEEEISNRENPFNEIDSVYMFRKNNEMESPIYSIHIKKFKKERKDENE